MQGFIKLHRQITEWEWYSNINVCRLFIHCLLKANHKDNKWQGIVIERGSFITSIENLAFETGLSGQQIRTALNKLKSTGEITSKTTNRYSVISIKNWNSYQLDNTQDNKQITNKQQTNNKQITTNNNDNNDKNEENEYREQANEKFANQDFILSQKYNFIQKTYLDTYNLNLGKQNQNAMSVMRSWVERDIKFEQAFPAVLRFYKNDYKWKDGTHPPFSWLLKDANNYFDVRNELENLKKGNN